MKLSKSLYIIGNRWLKALKTLINFFECDIKITINIQSDFSYRICVHVIGTYMRTRKKEIKKINKS